MTPVLQDATAPRLPSLTGMRAIAAVFVFLTHGIALALFANMAVTQKYILFAGNLGTFAVAYFFVLTGFVLAWSSRPGDQATSFWRRRFFKLFPNHVVSFVIIGVMLYLADPANIKVPEALANLFLVQAWFPDVNYLLYSVNGPTWSLNADLLCYAAFPLMFILIRKIRPNRLWFWAVVFAAIALLTPVFSHAFLPDHPASFFSPTGVSWPRQWFGFYFPLTRLLEFVVGMIMARIILAGRWVNIGVVPAALLLVAVYVATLNVSLFDGYSSLCLVPMALLINAVAVSDVNGRRTVLNGRPLVWLGEVSYAFFVLHITVMFTVHALFSHEWGVSGSYDRKTFSTVTGALLLAGIYLLCVLLAWILYSLVERPMVRRWSRPRPPQRPSSARTGRATATTTLSEVG